MTFFKKFSRSRGNSYIDDEYSRSPPQEGGRPPSSYQQGGQYSSSPSAERTVSGSNIAEKDMFPRGQHPDSYHGAPPSSAGRAGGAMHNGTGGSAGGGGGMRSHGDSMRDSGFGDAPTPLSPAHKPQGTPQTTAPDLLTHAFNEALRPHTEKIEMLEQQLADMQEWVQQQEQQRMEIYSWIDKRGLRPDVPPSIAKQMDETADAAATLNQQLDRKITIVNFDLHRLQDDLNDSISSAHFASAMAKFLPDIQRLASLRTGPRLAYELVIKLVGNLNSHGGLEATSNGSHDPALDEEIAEDRRARAAFYSRMDEELVDIVRKRNAEGEEWAVAREVKRLEKNGALLRNLGIDNYFPRSLDTMRREVEYKGTPGGMGTPPRYAQ